MKEGECSGGEVFRKVFGLSNDIGQEGIYKCYEKAHYNSDDIELKELDLAMKKKSNEIQNTIVK